MGLEKATEVASVPAGTSDTNLDNDESWPRKGGHWWLIARCHQCSKADLSAHGNRINTGFLFLHSCISCFLIYGHERMSIAKKPRSQDRNCSIFVPVHLQLALLGILQGVRGLLKKWQGGVSGCLQRSKGKVTHADGSVLSHRQPKFPPPSTTLSLQGPLSFTPCRWFIHSLIYFSWNATSRIELVRQLFKIPNLGIWPCLFCCYCWFWCIWR